MIEITPEIHIDESELEEHFIRASGPGGQNVNKVSTAVQLRFNLEGSPNLPEQVKIRARRLAGRRLTQDGILIIEAKRYRSQERNRADARARLVTLLQRAAEPVVPRRPTKPSKAAKERRLKSKSIRSHVKRLRSRVED
ncbi:MAG: aminoacyl-tRNA hydrolase [Alphaproteobacteria bacterium]|nr:MAG: aminoacyl-tRNA hydrolase [Alphaproteobacteria bacterium]